MMTDISRTIAAHWDQRAATFDEEIDHGLVDAGARAAWARRLEAWLPSPPSHVADLGCGTGTLAVLLAQRGHVVSASDLSPSMVQRAAAKAAAAGVTIHATIADAASPQLMPQSTDAVLVRHLAWTLPDPEAAIATWASLLRPKGRLVMVEGRWGTAAQAERGGDDVDIDHGDYTTIHRDLPWYGGVGADTLVPALRKFFGRVDHHDLTRDEHLWGRSVTDERYAVVAHLGG